ncbi:MAG: hypothetical protein WBD99_16365 [Thermodesulfobacteriota bacterium]
MKGDTIPDNDHIARLCHNKHVADEQIQATAFQLRQNEDALSANWLEFLSCSSRQSEIVEIRKIYSETFSSLGTRAKIAVLNVGEVREKVLTESPDKRELEVLHDPLVRDPSHSGIYNLKQDDELIAELILEAVRETYPARIEK